MTGRERVLGALRRQPVDRRPVANPTSVATAGLMARASAWFPEAHRNAEAMARLAATGHTELGYDTIMPVFSVVQESWALGCRVEWGERDSFPAVLMREPLWRDPEQIRIPADLLAREGTCCVLEAIRRLKREFGRHVAIVGKVMGPWTLAYHCFGVEQFLLMTVDDPGKVQLILNRLKEVTVAFGVAQIEAGADALTLPDHATGDLVRAQYYRRFLLDVHKELVERLPVPIILHICGKTLDRIPFIAETGVAAFHFDSKNNLEASVRAAGDRLVLAGAINNPVTLLNGTPEDVRRETWRNLEAGVGLIGPECAVPLATPVENLREIRRSVDHWVGGCESTG